MMIILTSIAYCVFLLAGKLGIFSYFWLSVTASVILLVMIIKIVGMRLSFISLPMILAVFSFLLLPFLAPNSWAYGFIAASSLVFASSLFLKKSVLSKENVKDGKKRFNAIKKQLAADKIIVIAVMAIGYTSLFAMMLFPVYENSYIPFWIVLLGIFATSSILFGEILKILEGFTSLIPLILGFMILETAWAISFWPLGFFSLAIVLLSISFMLLDISEQILSQNVSSVRMVYDIGVVISAILLVVMTTKWMPI